MLNSSDDDAIATDKQALLPGAGPATLANYTNYSGGINGIMVDVKGLPDGDGLTADSFDLKVGKDGDPGAWIAASRPLWITVRRGAGVDGSDREVQVPEPGPVEVPEPGPVETR